MISDNGKLSNYFPQLTGFRALAAAMVFFHHFNPAVEHPFLISFYDFFSEMHVGVSLFFVLSGFLITYRYKSSFQISFSWFSQYFLNRFARIYPVYALLTLLSYAIYILFPFINESTINTEFKTLFYNLTLIRGFFSGYKFTLIKQGWSLTVEEVFYLCCPFILLLINRYKISILLIWLCLTGVGFILCLMGNTISTDGFFSPTKFMLGYTFFGRSFEFLLGVLLGLNIEKMVMVKDGKNPLALLTFTGIAGIVLMLKVLACVRGDSSVGIQTFSGILANNFVLPFFVCAFIAGLILENSWITNVLKTKFFELLGRASYTFYLIHMGILQVFLGHHLQFNYWVVFILLWLVSILIYWFYEERMNHLIRKLSKGSR